MQFKKEFTQNRKDNVIEKKIKERIKSQARILSDIK